VRFEPGTFDARGRQGFCGASLGARPTSLARYEQSGAFLFRYGAWSIGALVDEMGVTPRFGVGERWLERRSAR
jgi:hypothetical protein